MPISKLARAVARGPKENVEQQRSRARLDAVGFVVMNLSQYRPSGITEGVSDTYAVHPGIGVAVWVEHKRRKGGRVSPEQEAFQALHEAASLAFDTRAVDSIGLGASRALASLGLGTPAHVIGATEEVDRFLVRCGLAELLPSGTIVLRPMKVAAYYAWHRVRAEEKARRDIARRLKKVSRAMRG